ncbi:MAG: methionine synthase, partial [Chloroflexi bacterium]|nr:methionine synthase [Chloroflexota bacterium]
HWNSTDALVYDGTPDVMAGYAYHVHQQGATLVGACCGSSPETIRAMRAALSGELPAAQLLMPQNKTSSASETNQTANNKPRRSRRRSRR